MAENIGRSCDTKSYRQVYTMSQVYGFLPEFITHIQADMK
jgi:hypothetical protein